VGEYVASNFETLWRGLARIPFVNHWLNKKAISVLAGRVPPRPEPLTTKSRYTSWASLTDRTYSSRHLPAVDGPPPAQPDLDELEPLFRRNGAMTPCPKSTVLFPSFAQWFTDDFLRTQREDPARGIPRDTLRNESSHQVDLVQLYGLDEKMTDALRLHHGGRMKSQQINGEEWPEHLCDERGEIKPEFDALIPPFRFEKIPVDKRRHVFAMGSDTRNLGFATFSVLFLREHNRVARELEKAYGDWDDDRIFETTRMILILELMKIVVVEYINHITPFHPRFIVRPQSFRKEPWQRPNWMGAEFNLLYRWHSLVPATYALPAGELNIEDSLLATPLLTESGLGPSMIAMSDQPAGRLGLFNTDEFLVKNAERPTVEQARFAELASYNDYREYYRLPRVKAFEQLSPSSEVQDRLKALYGEVDNVEFYVGLLAEEAGPNGVLGPLLTFMVALDAFSQILTNPLLGEQLYDKSEVFSDVGLKIIGDTERIADIVERNVPEDQRADCERISLTRRDYQWV
jgi:prostaglandin-endoperoxide synthase 2